MHNTATASRFCGSRGRWSALNIVLMIIGFAVFWPLGLAMLAWIVWGDEIGRMTADLKSNFRSFGDKVGEKTSFRSGFDGGFSRTGNVAFDEYREREIKRLEEERRKIDEMRAEFESFLKELRRVKDQEEFDRFMENFRNRSGGGETQGA